MITRKNRRPRPGQLLGNAENRRCRIDTQSYPRQCLTGSAPSKGSSDAPLSSAALKIDDSTLEPNGHSVGPIICTQFGQNIFDIAFDAFLGDG